MSDETSGRSCSRVRFLLVAGCCLATSSHCSNRIMWDVLDWGFFIELQQIQQNDVSY